MGVRICLLFYLECHINSIIRADLTAPSRHKVYSLFSRFSGYAYETLCRLMAHKIVILAIKYITL